MGRKKVTSSITTVQAELLNDQEIEKEEELKLEEH